MRNIAFDIVRDRHETCMAECEELFKSTINALKLVSLDKDGKAEIFWRGIADVLSSTQDWEIRSKLYATAVETAMGTLGDKSFLVGPMGDAAEEVSQIINRACLLNAKYNYFLANPDETFQRIFNDFYSRYYGRT